MPRRLSSLPWPTPLVSIFELLRLLVVRFIDARCFQAASALAFTSLLSLVPLITVAIVVFSHFPAFAEIGEELRKWLLDNLLPELAGNIIATYAFQFSEKATNLTLIGSAALVGGAIAVLLTIEDSFNHIWGVRHNRPMLTRLATYWAVLTIGPILFSGSIFASSYLVSMSLGLVNDPPWLREAMLRMMPVGLLGTLFSYLYFAIPNRRINPLHALAGGFLAAIAFLLMQRGFGYYIAQFPTYTLIYGTFAALPIFLLWLFLSWIIILVGGLVCASIPDFLARRQRLPNFPGDRACAALTVLALLAQAQQHGKSYASETLGAEVGLTVFDTESLLESLSEAGWIVKDEDGHWRLSIAAERIELVAVVERFALDLRGWEALGEHSPAALAAASLRQALHAQPHSLAELQQELGHKQDHQHSDMLSLQ